MYLTEGTYLLRYVCTYQRQVARRELEFHAITGRVQTVPAFYLHLDPAVLCRAFLMPPCPASFRRKAGTR